MEDDRIINFKSVTWVSDKGLAAALFLRNVPQIGYFLSCDELTANYLFPNTARVKRIIKAYIAGTLRVQARQYSWEIEQLEDCHIEALMGQLFYLNQRFGDVKKR